MLFVKVVGNSLISMYVVVIIVNLCETERLTSLCVKHAVKNAGLPDLFHFSHYASLYFKDLELAMLVCWSTPKHALEY